MLVASGGVAQAVRSAAANSVVARPMTVTGEKRVFLQLLRPSVGQLAAVGFEVYVNPVRGGGAATEAAQLVGVIAPFGWREHNTHHRSGNTGPQFDITDAVAMTALGETSIRVEIRPFAVATALPRAAGLQRKNAAARGAITFEGWRIYVAERPG